VGGWLRQAGSAGRLPLMGEGVGSAACSLYANTNHYYKIWNFPLLFKLMPVADVKMIDKAQTFY
jgi:hypothetical protein